MSPGNEEEALVGNAADAKQVREAGNTVKRRENALKASWNSVLETPAGRAVIYDLLEQCGIYAGGFSAELAHYNEGRRNVGLFILAKLDRQPEKYALMMRENKKEID